MERLFEAERWHRLFEERQRYPLPLMSIPSGPRDRSPEVLRVLRIAAVIERRGVEVLIEKSQDAGDPGEASCIAHHAREEAAHAQMLEDLLGDAKASPLPGVLGVAAGFVTRRRPITEQMLITLLVEAMGIAVYALLAEALRPGRVAVAFESIVDDERLHADFLREILVAEVAGQSPRKTRRLRWIRTVIVGVFVVVHALLHRKYLRPLGITSASEVRARILDEIERTLRGIPELAVPTAG